MTNKMNGKMDDLEQAQKDYNEDMASILKPLFIPLRTEYYEAFERGEKSIEYRQYGKRWNHQTCLIGRRVVLSKGYGKQSRISGTIAAFGRIQLKEAPSNVANIYPDGEKDIAAIGIELKQKESDNAE